MPPTTEHELWLDLFTNNPRLAPDLLEETFGVHVPYYEEARVESPVMNESRPVELRADHVIVLRNRGRPVLACVVEVQRNHDARKEWSWPKYVTAVRARHKCPTILLVMWPHADGAERVSTPIALGPASMVTPHVIGLSALPLVTDEALAIAKPELATLSALAHADGPHRKEVLTAARAGIRAFRKKMGKEAQNYTDYLSVALSKDASELWRKLMGVGTYEYQSEWARGAVAHGKAQAVLAILAHRNLTVTDEVRDRILDCVDPELTAMWLDRAFQVSSAEELLSPV
ncbi:hypothetical protein [Herbidospora mongoliensis]|uniref:hypothetical protein n=1 Tax=Herbidospora mongoliensis TaxID=688067 RepID=UPI000836D50D|nr:hypothetical protein [Herbidospora mongoliensis]